MTQHAGESPTGRRDAQRPLEERPGESGYVALVEMGGSRIRSALALPSGPVARAHQALPPPEERDLTSILDRIAFAGLRDQRVPARAVVAWPGPLTPEGLCWASPTVAGGAEIVDVASELSARWDGAEVVLVNDLTAAGLRLVEQGRRDFAIVTVGSGIGHKVFYGGVPLVGPHGRGGELGHLLVDRRPDAQVCSCGLRGHLGGLASGRGIVQAVTASWPVRDEGGPSSPRVDAGPEVVARFRDGEPGTVRIVTERARLLGWGLALLHLAVGTEEFVVVGGFSRAAGEEYRRQVVAGAAESGWDLGLDWDRAVSLGADDDDHGLIGAWRIARESGWLR
jgi:glucokinase